jgi:hypothetical protein
VPKRREGSPNPGASPRRRRTSSAPRSSLPARGLDATLKQLIRDTLPGLLDKNEQAHKKFEAFAAARLGTAEFVDPKMIARYLVAANAREQMIEDYVYELTGSSLQSADQVQATAGALGIENPGNVRRKIVALADLFTARNQLSHELDLSTPERPGDRTRRSRAVDPTVELCQGGLEVAQLIVNAAGALLAA